MSTHAAKVFCPYCNSRHQAPACRDEHATGSRAAITLCSGCVTPETCKDKGYCITPHATPDRAAIRVRPIFAWYDLWIGVFVDRSKRRVYVFPLPCIGLVVSW